MVPQIPDAYPIATAATLSCNTATEFNPGVRVDAGVSDKERAECMSTKHLSSLIFCCVRMSSLTDHYFMS